MVRRRETIEEQMARAQQDKKAATVRTSASSRGVRTPSRPAVGMLIASALAALWAAVMLTGAGQKAYAYGFFFTEFFAGVISLVALSLTVMLGLLATDRLVLRIPHRVLMQSAHRATGVLGVAGLGFHVLTKVATGRAAATDAVVPFVGGRGLYVGLGTVAALLMVSVIWTGIIRARFADVGPKWLWRALHSVAYLAWPFAVLHGLNAGRAAAPWVMFSYLGCILLVVLALLVRLSVSLGRRSREQHQAAARNAAMAGRAGDAKAARSLLAGLGRRSNSAAEKRPAWADTTTATWAAPPARRDPERFTVPVVPEPGSLVEPTRPSRRRREEEPAARRDTERSSRSRRGEAEPTTRRSPRRGVEETDTRRRDEEELQPVARRRGSRTRDEEASAGRRRAEESAAERPSRRSRREDEDSRYSAPPLPTPEPEEPWDSPRRWQAAEPISAGPVSAEPISSSPISATPRSGSGRHSAEDDLPEEPDYWRPPARYVPDEVPPVDDTPTLVDLASRRAKRAAGEGRSAKRRKASADAVDGAYWAGLRGEAK
ncbi:ferric reductase-like transmembrane domain-containing protein [Micromonospora sp. WMMD1155]|uniref:ferric reductase-like transmembrane domain-containing protein n=1 Tax=Micromonospora sp. WMMD1155 TaxID=3016094 RepID=UPI00249A41AE|nr:ferric reductase-like transmembrane domain-containing protein [Micromonospora sp. WMMD1155]WFE52426.1 ferric reductase-like transmembrane domain-containing protein [Micromonospora sp. WMMD1155]